MTSVSIAVGFLGQVLLSLLLLKCLADEFTSCRQRP